MKGVENGWWMMTFYLLQIMFISNVYYKVTLYFCFPPTSMATIQHSLIMQFSFASSYIAFYGVRQVTAVHSGSCIFYKSRFWLINQPFFVLHNICLCHPRLINSNHHEPFWCIGIRSYGNVYFFLIILFLGALFKLKDLLFWCFQVFLSHPSVKTIFALKEIQFIRNFSILCWLHYWLREYLLIYVTRWCDR